jgi:hypothetical protein
MKSGGGSGFFCLVVFVVLELNLGTALPLNYTLIPGGIFID